MVKAAEAVAAASLVLQMVTMFSLLINSNIQVSVANFSFLKMIEIAKKKKLFTFENALYAIQMGKENIGIIGNTDSGDKMKRRIDDIKEASENVVAGVPDEKILRPLLVSYLAPAPGDRWKRSSVSENDILNPTDEIGTFGKRITSF